MIADTPVLTDAQRLELQQDEKIILAPESVCELFDLSQLKDNIELEVNPIHLFDIITQKITMLF